MFFQTPSQNTGLDSEFNKLMSDTSAPGIIGTEHKATEDRETPYAGNVMWLCLQSGEKEDTSEKKTKKDEMENPFYIKEIKEITNPKKGRKYGLTIATWNTRGKRNEKRESRWKDKRG